MMQLEVIKHPDKDIYLIYISERNTEGTNIGSVSRNNLKFDTVYQAFKFAEKLRKSLMEVLLVK